MKEIIRVTRDSTGGHDLVYVSYSDADDLTVARSENVTETGSVVLDLDAAGEVLGVELLDPNTRELEALAQVARDRDLSLAGLFSHSHA